MNTHALTQLHLVFHRYLDPESSSLIAELNDDLKHNRRFRRLNESLGTLIEDYSMVSFLPCSVRDEEQIELVQAHIDHMLQYGEDLEVKGRLCLILLLLISRGAPS